MKRCIVILPWLALLGTLTGLPALADSVVREDLYRTAWTPPRPRTATVITVPDGTQSRAPSATWQGTSRAAPNLTNRRYRVEGDRLVVVDDAEQFNRQWMQQHLHNAEPYEGTEAGRKLLQRVAKNLWNRFGRDQYTTAQYVVEHLDSSVTQSTRHYNSRRGELDYRIRVSADDVKLKLDYTF